MGKKEDALKIDDVRVVAGRLIPVYNKGRKAFSNARKKYMAVWVENSDGKNERCLLFTEKELERAAYRAQRNPEDCPKKGIIADLLD